MLSSLEPRSRSGQYQRLKENVGVEAARELVRTVLEENSGNIALTCKILGITRPTARRARDGSLSDEDKTPKSQPRLTETKLENFILAERKATGYGRIRLAKYLKTKGLSFSPNTIGNILRRHPVQKQVYTRPSSSKLIYDYEALLPFEELQIDVKYVEDYGALGTIAFIPRKLGLPLFQWTAIDAKTKMKFLAYSYELNAGYGLWLMQLVVWWLRSHGIRHHINFQADNGSEFAAGSKLKEAKINETLSYLGAGFRSIPAGKKYLQGIVERTHRTDDEEFYRPHLPRAKDREDFLVRAQRYQDTFNCVRQHWGKGMEGRTPVEKLEACKVLSAKKKAAFPVMVLDDLFAASKDLNKRSEKRASMNLTSPVGGKDVSGHYHYA